MAALATGRISMWMASGGSLDACQAPSACCHSAVAAAVAVFRTSASGTAAGAASRISRSPVCTGGFVTIRLRRRCGPRGHVAERADAAPPVRLPEDPPGAVGVRDGPPVFVVWVRLRRDRARPARKCRPGRSGVARLISPGCRSSVAGLPVGHASSLGGVVRWIPAAGAPRPAVWRLAAGGRVRAPCTPARPRMSSVRSAR